MAKKLSSHRYRNSKKVVQIYFVVNTLGMLGLVLLFISIIKSHYNDYNRVHQNTIVEQFVNYTREDFLSGDHASVYQKCQGVLNDETLVGISFIDSNGKDICLNKDQYVPESVIEKKIYFDEKKSKVAASIKASFKDLNYMTLYGLSVSIFILFTILLGSSQYFLLRRITKNLLRPLIDLTETMKNSGLSKLELSKKYINSEMQIIVNTYNRLFQEITLYQNKEIEMAKGQALYKSAQELTHNIRTPLSSLEMLLNETEGITSERKMRLSKSINRIKDISNNFLAENRNKAITTDLETLSEVQLVTSISESVSEMRSKFRGRNDVEINFDPSMESYLVFSSVNDNLLKTVCSNLITNAVEAKNKDIIEINVDLKKADKDCVFEISDNGKGISKSILEKFKVQTFSHGKKDGNGIGLRHAIETMKVFGGDLRIESVENQGTTLRIRLPLVKIPKWLSTEVMLANYSKVLVLDDEIDIHEFWKEKLKQLNISLECFATPESLSKRVDELKGRSFTVFCDYSLGEAHENGLDFLERKEIIDRAFLVTSHYSTSEIINKASQLGIKIIPKDYLKFLKILEV